jgi:hypothetical protein
MNKLMGRGFFALAVLAIVAIASNPVLAQGRGGRGGGRMQNYSMSRLATLAEVQADLKLNDEQKTKITEIADQVRGEAREVFQAGAGGGNVDFAKLQQIYQDASDKVNALLDASQQKRLMEITVQVNGPAALSEAAVRKQLMFTDEQNTKFAEAVKTNQEAMRSLRDLPREEQRDKRQELNKEADEKLLGILTAQQKTEFEALKGAPLTVDLSPLAPRGGGGGRRNNNS